jgi:NADH-quinone oxidoreductase subunit A
VQETLLGTVSLDLYGGLLAVIAFAMLVAGAILVLSYLIGPKRQGPVKHGSYESGMPPISDARRRFGIRFYVVAVLFLLFDVEVLLLWPWAPLFVKACREGTVFQLPNAVAGAGFLLVAMAIFLFFLIVGFVYEWRRGVFRWD